MQGLGAFALITLVSFEKTPRGAECDLAQNTAGNRPRRGGVVADVFCCALALGFLVIGQTFRG